VTQGVVVTEYVDNAAATMVTERDGSGRFTEAVLYPVVTVADEAMVEQAERAHERANQLCFIANSVSFPIRHEPTTEVGS
jgi:organic hydroperoxide reductase OsmC/OhrA